MTGVRTSPLWLVGRYDALQHLPAIYRAVSFKKECSRLTGEILRTECAERTLHREQCGSIVRLSSPSPLSLCSPCPPTKRNKINNPLTSPAEKHSPADLLLLDAGATKSHYITDLTRTIPISGAFSPAQRDLYTAVLTVQRDIVSLCRESSGLSLDGLHARAEEGLKRELSSLGFDLKGKDGAKRLGELFPHHVGHWIGLEVHDTPGRSRSKKLRRGECVTVEP